MFLIRPAVATDIEHILAVATHLDTVNLPADRDSLRQILDLAVDSFSGAVPIEEREYLFVLEDLATGVIIGTSMIHAQHGTRRAPHVYFNITKEERYSETLDRFFRHECLRIGYDYDGPTEIGGLILLPQYRGHVARLGTFLSYVRFLYIAAHRAEFRDEIISELLPPLEPDGTSKLWEHLGRRFTGLTYQEADRVSKHNKEFIRALFPHGLIYTALFPDSVREVIGQVGPESLGVEKILTRIGFRYAHQIDPFDGGPHFKARTDDITLVAGSTKRRVAAGSPGPDAAWTIAMRASEPMRAAAGPAQIGEGGAIELSPAQRQVLEIEAGDEVWCVTP